MSDKLKVILAINELTSKAGAEVMFSQLAEELLSNNTIDVRIVILYGNVDPFFMPFINRYEKKIFILNKKNSFDFSAAKKFKKIINDFQPNVINLHLSCLITYFFAFGFKRKPWKIIQTVHSIANKEATKIDMIIRGPYIRKKMLSFIGISKKISESILELFPKSRVDTIYNGIKFPKNVPLYNPENKKYDLICVARFHPIKNHKLLVDVFDDLHKLDNKSKLILLGTGELLENTKQYVKNKGLENEITFAGMQKDVYPFLYDSKAFILSSIYEGNPISILEAMAAGLPIIAPDVGGITDVVSNDLNGMIYNISDEASSIANKIHLLLKNEKEMVNMSQNSKKIVKKYSIEECARSYVSVFKIALKPTEDDNEK